MFRHLFAALILAASFGFVASPALGAGENGVDQALLGLNGILTSPADPIMGAIEGTSFVSTPVVTNVAGFFTGCLAAVERAVLGVIDIPAAVTPLTALSPPARFGLVVKTNETPGPPAGF